jgi:predicted transcriptional regulator
MKYAFSGMTTRMEKVIIGIGVKRKVLIIFPPQRNCWQTSSMTLIGGTMKTVILEVRSPKEAMDGFAQAWRTNKQQKAARISFASPELLWKVLTAKRWELLKVLCGAGPVSIREAARRVGRDVKGVHGDVVALLNAGLLVRTENGAIEFPYETIKVEFLLQAA